MMFYHRNSFANQILFPSKRWLQPRWRGKQAQKQINMVDGPTNPLGKVYSKTELQSLMSGFERLEFQTEHMFFHWERLLPGILSAWINHRWGWCLYVKAYKPTRAVSR
jgi:hypothetical protein